MTTPHPLQQAFPSLMKVLVEKYQAVPQWAAVQTWYGEQADPAVLLDILSKLHYLDEVKDFQKTFADRVSSAWQMVEKRKIKEVEEEARTDGDPIEAISNAVMNYLALIPMPWAAVKSLPLTALEDSLGDAMNNLYEDDFQTTVMNVTPVDGNDFGPVDITFRVTPDLDFPPGLD